MHNAPLWLMKATLPGRAMLWANVAFRPVIGFITPRQFGPITPHLSANEVGNLTLQILAVLAKFLEARRDDNGSGDAQAHRLANDIGNGIRRGADDYEVNLVREISEFRVCLDAENIRPLGIDGEHRTAERMAQQVPQDRASYAARALGGADNRYALGREYRIQRIAFGAINIRRRVELDLGRRALGSSHGSSPKNE